MKSIKLNLFFIFFIILTILLLVLSVATASTVETTTKTPTTTTNEKPTITLEKSKTINRLNNWAKPFKRSHSFSIKKRDNTERLEFGIFGDQDIKANTELLDIKWTSCLTIDTLNFEQNQLFTKMAELKLAQEDILMVGLMVYRECMKKEAYNLKDWVKSLPEEYESSLYFQESDMQYLRGSPAFVDIMIQQDQFQTLYHQLETTLFNDPVFTDKCGGKVNNWEQQFKWAYSTITARKIYVPDPDSKNDELSPVVPPIVDFFNHANDPDASIDYNDEMGTIDVKTLKDIKQGQEIFVNYDRHYCPSDLLADYGYLPMDFDSTSCVNVLVEELLETINPADPIKDEKTLLVHKLFEQKDQKLKLSMDSLTEDLLKISKYIAYQQESLLEYLKSLIDLKISHYPTTIDQDKEFLLSNDYTTLSSLSKLAFNLSFQEKQILQSVYTKIQQNIDSIDNTSKKSRDEL